MANINESKIYYAHSKKIYGTRRELKEVTFLRKIFPKRIVICPNNDVGELGCFNDYLKIVDDCRIVAASEVDGYIGRGVFHEIARGISNESQIYVIREQENALSLKEVIGIEFVNRRDYVLKYGKLIVKKMSQ